MARSRSPGVPPAAVISTNVPSAGRALRVTQADIIECQDPLDAFGDMPRGERGTGDIADIAVEFQGIAIGLADELRKPIPIVDLAAIGFAIFQHFDPTHLAVGRQRDGIVDDEVLTDDIVEDEIAEEAAIGLGAPHLLAARLDPDARLL